MKLFAQSLRMLLLLTLVTGVAYPLAVTGIAQLVFADRAGGSLIVRDGRTVGSSLIGQPFSDAKYFWSRPSATASMPYDAGASSGSNQGPLNRTLHDAVKARVGALRDADPDHALPIPVDLVTASGSGLDPHLSPAAAEYQVARVARARGMHADDLRALVAEHTRGRQLGFLGEPRVNVLELNLALDAGERRAAVRDRAAGRTL
jgi:K+-transporting ATPase ATPase C chain